MVAVNDKVCFLLHVFICVFSPVFLHLCFHLCFHLRVFICVFTRNNKMVINSVGREIGYLNNSPFECLFSCEGHAGTVKVSRPQSLLTCQTIPAGVFICVSWPGNVKQRSVLGLCHVTSVIRHRSVLHWVSCIDCHEICHTRSDVSGEYH